MLARLLVLAAFVLVTAPVQAEGARTLSAQYVAGPTTGGLCRTGTDVSVGCASFGLHGPDEYVVVGIQDKQSFYVAFHVAFFGADARAPATFEEDGCTFGSGRVVAFEGAIPQGTARLVVSIEGASTIATGANACQSGSAGLASAGTIVATVYSA